MAKQMDQIVYFPGSALSPRSKHIYLSLLHSRNLFNQMTTPPRTNFG